MANVKISELTAASTPLAGTEVLPIVQSGGTVKVSVANLTAGRAISVSSLTLSGGTANGVAYLNGSKNLTAGSALYFDGTNLGVGTTDPLTKLDVLGEVSIAWSASYGLRFYNQDRDNWSSIGNSTPTGNSSSNLVFKDYTGEVARMTEGSFLVGTTAYPIVNTKLAVLATGSSYGATIVNNIANYQTLALWNKATAGTIYFAEFGSGTTYVARGSITYDGTVTSYNTTSDYRLKNTIAPITGALAKVALLKPCTYKWNSNGLDGEGFIAHELAEVFPSAVAGEKDAVDNAGNPKYQGIDTSFLVATLTAAIQELKAEFDAYKASHS